MAQVTQRMGAGDTATADSCPTTRSHGASPPGPNGAASCDGALPVLALIVMVAASARCHTLMDREGRADSWPTSVYWTLTTMTTLGFGDITFESDAGRIFSIVVLLSGSVFLLGDVAVRVHPVRASCRG